MEPLTIEQLEDQLCDLIKAKKPENKPHIGTIHCRKWKSTHPVTRPNRCSHSEFSNLKTALDLIMKYFENLHTEIEVIKMFAKDQFWLLKNYNGKQSVCVSA